MQIIFTKELADTLAEKYTLLQLDTIEVEGHGEVEAFCVLEPENVVMEMSSLSEKVAMHKRLVEAIHRDERPMAIELCKSLKGSFSGELDSFYDVILERIATTNTTKLPKKSLSTE